MKNRQAITKLQAIIIAVILIAVVLGGVYYFILSKPATIRTEIKIGAAVAQTGAQAVYGSRILRGYELWAKKVNEAGGIFGLPVKLVVYDDKSDPTTTKALYERLITVDHVDYLFGPYGSANSKTMAPVAEKYKMVVLHPCACSAQVYPSNFEYQFETFVRGIADIFEPKAQFICTLPEEIRPKSIGIIYTSTAFAKSTAIGAKATCEKYGVNIPFYEEVPEGASDVSGVILKLKEVNPEAVIITGYFPDEVLIVRTMIEMNFNPKILATTTTFEDPPDFVANLGEKVNGIIGGMYYWIDMPTDVNKQFVEAFRATYGEDPTAYEAHGYTTGLVLEAALKSLGPDKLGDQEALRECLLNIEVPIPMGTWKVDKAAVDSYNLHYPCEPRFVIGQLFGTKVKVIYPPEVAEANFVYPKPPW